MHMQLSCLADCHCDFAQLIRHMHDIYPHTRLYSYLPVAVQNPILRYCRYNVQLTKGKRNLNGLVRRKGMYSCLVPTLSGPVGPPPETPGPSQPTGPPAPPRAHRSAPRPRPWVGPQAPRHPCSPPRPQRCPAARAPSADHRGPLHKFL